MNILFAFTGESERPVMCILRVLEQDPLSGHLCLLVNRLRDKLKILYWDGDGLAIWYRRLEQDTFQMPTIADDQKSAEIRSEELTMLLRGIDLNSARRRKRFSMAMAARGRDKNV